MGHDETKVLLGSTKSSFKVIDNSVGSIEAGLVVHQKSDGTISVAKADGSILGVSIGKDLSDAGRTNVVRAGLGVPVLVKSGQTPVLGAQVAIHDTTGDAGTVGETNFTAVNAVYVKVGLTGIKEDGTTATVALIDMQGGL